MGEQELFPSSTSNPVYIVIMRNSRGKFFVYVAVLGLLCFIVFLLSSTHSSLKELESVNEKCQQQRDSLSAQLQVLYEHKNRLEKSLQQEKTDHRHTKEENEKQLHQLDNKFQEETTKIQKLEAQITTLKTSYTNLEEEKAQSENELSEKLKNVQVQKDKEIEKLQNHITELLAEKDKLEMSNNAQLWKVEQEANELKFCHLQHDQTKTELVKCQEQVQKNLQNTEEGHLLSKLIPSEKKAVNDNMIKVDNDHPQPLIQTDIKATNHKEYSEKNATSQPPTDKKVLSKPHILQQNNVDGVLPKPVDDKIDDVDAAVEVPEVKKGERDAKLLHINQRDPDNKISLLHDEKKENLDIALKHVPGQKEQENHPQVLPPNNFDIGDKDDHAAERGEYGNQYGLPEARQQLENSVFNNKHNAKRKNMMPLPQQMNGDIAAQMQDMMNKSPGDINHFDDQNGIHMPPQGFGAIDDKIREFKNADSLMHRGGDVNNVMEDKNYEEDDDDRENDDEQVNGMEMKEMKGVQVLQDNDFDDQENQENVNAKEEGVVVAPK